MSLITYSTVLITVPSSFEVLYLGGLGLLDIICLCATKVID